MAKPPEMMNTQELGRLYPIILAPYNTAYPAIYEAEARAVVQAAGPENVVRITHFGSTAVPGLLSKPTVDILLEVREGINQDALIHAMKAAGYRYSLQPGNPPPHMMFMKGYTPKGFVGQAFHVHVRFPGDWDEIYFRDYLQTHPETAAAYARLKQELKERFAFDREAYTQGKTAFIKNITSMARAAKSRT